MLNHINDLKSKRTNLESHYNAKRAPKIT
uniref:Uncharacterized protein n=1 Tax=Rhizophora mucronata TaxID=61149 RepID=A0A2P2MYV9_RHIMU